MDYKALLLCAEEKLTRVVSQVFSDVGFILDHTDDSLAAVSNVTGQRYDAIVVDCDNDQNASLLFTTARTSVFNQGSLAIGLVDGQAGVARAYRMGANLVLTKPINLEQAKATLRVAKGLLRKNAEAPPAESPLVAGTVTPRPSSDPAFVQPLAPGLTQAASEANFGSSSLPVESSVLENVPSESGVSPAFPPLLAEMEEAPAPAAASTQRNWISITNQPQAGASGVSDPTVQEVTPPAARPVVTVAGGSVAAAFAPAPEKVEHAAEPSTPKDLQEPAAGAVLSAPQEVVSHGPQASPGDAIFSAATAQSERSGHGIRNTILLAVAAVVIGALAFLSWLKLGSDRSVAATPHRTQAQNLQSSSSLVGSTQTSSEMSPSQAAIPASTRSPATTSAPSVTFSSKPEHQSPRASSATQMTIVPQPGLAERSPAPIVVRPSNTEVKTQLVTEEQTAPPPSPLALESSAPAALNAVISVPSSAPRPSLVALRVSQGVSQGLLIKRVQPLYPANAIAAHAQGAVEIEATIDKEGNVLNPKVLKGNPILAAAALNAVRQWRYKPYYLDGEPIEIQTQITVNFKTGE